MKLIAGVALLAGCGRLAFDERLLDSAGTCAGFGPWQTPVRLAASSATAADRGSEITRDGLAIYFHSNRMGTQDLWVATRSSRDDAFGEAVRITELDDGGESGPTVTEDQLEMFYSRIGCIFRSRRLSKTMPWTPSAMTQVCTGLVDGSHVSADGLTLYYNTQVSGGEGEIYETTRASRSDVFMLGAKIPVLAGMPYKGYPSVSYDELTLYYEAEGPPIQLWSVTRADKQSPFENPAKLEAPINSGLDDDEDLSITADGREVVFSSSRDGNPDLYLSKRDCVP